MTAQRWFRAAAELGHGQAQPMLGRYLPKASPASQTRRRRARGSSKPLPRASKKHRPISPHCTRRRCSRAERLNSRQATTPWPVSSQ